MLRQIPIAALLLLLATAVVSIAPLHGQNIATSTQQVTTAVAASTPRATPTLGVYYERDLTRAPREVWAQQALGFTQFNIRILDGIPDVVYAEPILATELAPLGLIDVPYPDDDPPLALVIVRGHFDFGTATQPVGYVGYTMDLSTGWVMTYSESFDGSTFSRILTDPSIPHNPPPAATPVPRQTRPAPQMAATPRPRDRGSASPATPTPSS